MPTLRNTNPLGDVDDTLLGRRIAAGEEFEVSDEVAGRAPAAAVLNKDGSEKTPADPGAGLLAQVGNYELVEKKG